MLTLSTPGSRIGLPLPGRSRLTKKKRPRAKARGTYHHGDLRRALLDEALAIIASEGVDALTLRGIGARLGVSRSALYRHFADKRALLAAVATEGFRTLRERLVEAWEQGGRDAAAFREMGVAYTRFAVENPAHYRVMFSRSVDPEPSEPELVTEARGAFRALVDAVADLQREGRIRGDDTLLVARYVWAVVHGVAMLAIDRQIPDGPDVEALARYAVERLDSGIGSA